MNAILKYFSLTAILIGTIIYLLQKEEYPLPRLINNYANDLLIVPILLFFSLLFLRWSRNEKKLHLSLPVILYISTLYSFLFEFLFPSFLERYTKDYWDVLCYFLGGIVFYLLQTKTKTS